MSVPEKRRADQQDVLQEPPEVTSSTAKKWKTMRVVSKFLRPVVDMKRVPASSIPELDAVREVAAQIYRRYDKDRNGTLDYEEFRVMVLNLGVSHAYLHKNRVEQFIRSVDVNKDNVISFDEFLDIYIRMLKWDQDRATIRAPMRAHFRLTSALDVQNAASEPDVDWESLPRICVRSVSIGGHAFVMSDRYRHDDKLLGRGAYGLIASAEDTRTKTQVVFKKIAAVGHPIVLQATARELAILHHLRKNPHENLMGLFDIMPPPPGGQSQWDSLFLVMERMDCDLHAIIRSSQPLTDDHCQFFSYQLLRGLAALHSANIMHRDLKPSNLLVNRDCTLKISDYGLSRPTSTQDASVAISDADEWDDLNTMTTYVITRYYRAPEVLLQSSCYGFRMDIWSAGCIIAEMILRKPLNCGKTVDEQMQLIVDKLGHMNAAEEAEYTGVLGIPASKVKRFVRGTEDTASQPSRIAQELTSQSTLDQETGGINMCLAMLKYSPTERISAEEALQGTWLKDFHECNAEPRLPELIMPHGSGLRISRKHLQAMAVNTIKELHAQEAPSVSKAPEHGTGPGTAQTPNEPSKDVGPQ